MALKVQQQQILKAKATKALGTSLLIIPELRVLVLTKRHVGSGNEIDLFFGDNKAAIAKEKLQYLKTAKLKIPRGRKSELVVSCQVLINPFCGLSVIFCGFISHLIGRKTINIPEIFSGVHGFTGKTVTFFLPRLGMLRLITIIC